MSYYPNVYASQTGPLLLSGLDANFNFAVDIQSQSLYAAAGGSSDIITATYTPAITSLVSGLTLYLRATSANTTTTPTFSPNSLTAKTIVKVNNQALAAGDIAGAGHILILQYDATNGVWELANPQNAAGKFTSITNTSLTSGRVVYSTTGGLETDSANLTFDGTTLTAAGLAGPFNGTVGATTANTGAFTTLSASSTVSGTGFSTYLASPPAIGGTAAAAGSFTTLAASSTVSGTGFSTYLASPPAIGGTAPAAGTFTSVSVANTFSSASTFGFKNRIINGALQFWQRGTSFTGSAQYTADRWATDQSTNIISQSSDVPNTLYNYSIDVNANGAGNTPALYQRIESYNIQDVASGTVTISFWGKLISGTATTAVNLRYPATRDVYSGTVTSFSSTNVTLTTSWAQYFVTVSSLPAGVANGLMMYFIGTNGADFRVTGVQLEKGSTATSFDYRDYGTELFLCQRYYQKLAGFTCVGSSTTDVALSIPFALPMRTTPSVGQTGVLTIEDIGTADRTQSSTSISIRASRIDSVGGTFTLSNFTLLVQFRPYIQNVNFGGADNFITLNAEL
jgi:hypothetical protein